MGGQGETRSHLYALPVFDTQYKYLMFADDSEISGSLLEPSHNLIFSHEHAVHNYFCANTHALVITGDAFTFRRCCGQQAHREALTKQKIKQEQPHDVSSKTL